MNARVYVSIGSNIEAEINVRLGIAEMRRDFGTLILSPVYQSAAVGFVGDDFLNMVAGFDTSAEVREVVQTLRAIEDRLGRDRSQTRFSKRPIDLDILTYDALVLDQQHLQIPRHEIIENAYVLKPLCDIAADEMHPVLKQSFRQLWEKMAPGAPRLELVELDL